MIWEGGGSILVRAIIKKTQKHKQLERVLTWLLGEGKLSNSTIQWVTIIIKILH